MDIDTGCKTINRSDLCQAIDEACDALKEDRTVQNVQALGDLVALLEEGDSATGRREGGSDWLLIADFHFQEWAQDYANGLGETNGWPYDHIDWKKAAESLQQDYRQVPFSDETYWVRA